MWVVGDEVTSETVATDGVLQTQLSTWMRDQTKYRRNRMSEEFPCKQPTCTYTVSYTPIIVDALIVVKGVDVNQLDQHKVVYLACPAGHTYPYNV